MRNHLKFYSAPTGSKPSIADFTFEPFFARDFANQAFPFSACNIEKWVWPGNEAKVNVLMYLEFVPEVFNWVCIGTLGGRPPPVDVVVFKEFLGTTRRVFGIIILHKSMSTRICLLTERNEAPV